MSSVLLRIGGELWRIALPTSASGSGSNHLWSLYYWARNEFQVPVHKAVEKYEKNWQKFHGQMFPELETPMCLTGPSVTRKRKQRGEDSDCLDGYHVSTFLLFSALHWAATSIKRRPSNLWNSTCTVVKIVKDLVDIWHHGGHHLELRFPHLLSGIRPFAFVISADGLIDFGNVWDRELEGPCRDDIWLFFNNSAALIQSRVADIDRAACPWNLQADMRYCRLIDILGFSLWCGSGAIEHMTREILAQLAALTERTMPQIVERSVVDPRLAQKECRDILPEFMAAAHRSVVEDTNRVTVFVQQALGKTRAQHVNMRADKNWMLRYLTKFDSTFRPCKYWELSIDAADVFNKSIDLVTVFAPEINCMGVALPQEPPRTHARIRLHGCISTCICVGCVHVSCLTYAYIYIYIYIYLRATPTAAGPQSMRA